MLTGSAWKVIVSSVAFMLIAPSAHDAVFRARWSGLPSAVQEKSWQSDEIDSAISALRAFNATRHEAEDAICPPSRYAELVNRWVAATARTADDAAMRL